MSARRALVLAAVLLFGGGVVVMSRAASRNAEATARRFGLPPTLRHASMARTAFQPARLEVSAGDTVEWTNADIVTHSVTADDGQAFGSPDLAPNAAWRTVARTPGRYPFHCELHPTMKGELVVK